MNDGNCICDSTESCLERVRYFSGQPLNAHDLTDDQTYHRAKQRLHNRLLHGWGIVCGLDVKVVPNSGPPLNVTICPGFALSPQGDEIYVPQEVQFDLATCTTGPATNCCSTPCSPLLSNRVDPAKPFWIAIRYAQCPSRPVRVPPLGCGCDDTACEYSRIRDSFEITCLAELPASYDAQPALEGGVCSLLTETKVVRCPPCPDDPWVVLANVKLVAQIPQITFEDRRIVLSAALLQQHVTFQCS